ncbi:hypothetical protein [Paenibacillus sp. sgz5001063]|uniref:hypothetical protein n=1 Tax=Paenibacillus sp. sgz5001063 TaxID=3242474 RepID=UPI0036D32DCD
MDGCKSIHILVREKGIKVALREINKKLVDRLGVMSLGVRTVKANSIFCMADFQITLDVAGKTEGHKAAMKRVVHDSLEVFEHVESDDKLRFTSYRGEGSIVFEIKDILEIVNHRGPAIVKIMKQIGISDYMIDFDIEVRQPLSMQNYNN